MNWNTQAAEILDDAASLLIERGWINSNFTGPNGELCVWRALVAAYASEATEQVTRFDSTFVLAEDALVEAAGTTLGGLFLKNDATPLDEGLSWATGVLYDARDSLDPYFLERELRNKPVEQNWFTRKVSALWNWRKSNQA